MARAATRDNDFPDIPSIPLPALASDAVQPVPFKFSPAQPGQPE